MRREQIFLLLLFALVLLAGCTSGKPTDLLFWFCVISFAVAVVCGLVAVLFKDDNTRVAGAVICVIFLIVSLGILA
jgi:hypothetical protein